MLQYNPTSSVLIFFLVYIATLISSKHLAKNVSFTPDAEREVTEKNKMAGSHYLASNRKKAWQIWKKHNTNKKIWLLISYTKLIKNA